MTQTPWPGTAPQTQDDPFESREKMPSVSFDKDEAGNRLNPPVTYELEVVRGAELVQERDENGKPVYWLDQWGRPENPKMKVVVTVRHNGVVKGLWAKKWDAEGTLFRAISDAQKAAGVKIGPGGKLTVQWYASEQPKHTTYSGKKLYRARYEPNVFVVAPDPTSDPFAAQSQEVAQAAGWGQQPDQALAAARQAAAAATAAVQGPQQWQDPSTLGGGQPQAPAWTPPPAPAPAPASPAPVQAAPVDPWANDEPPF
jgi:hypothetical protein